MGVMKIDKAFLSSKVGRRIFFLFVVCALLPLGAMTLLSFLQVTAQLHDQSRRRLHQAAKAMVMTISERLSFLEAEMQMVAAPLRAGSGGVSHLFSGEKALWDRLGGRFSALALVDAAGRRTPLFGGMEDPPVLGQAEREWLGTGMTFLGREYGVKLPPRIFMAIALDPARPARGVLMARVNPGYLWGNREVNPLPLGTELCVLDQGNKLIFSSLPGAVSFPEQDVREMSRSKFGQFAWRRGEAEYVASYRSLFLKAQFGIPPWIVVLSESRADVLAPMAHFKELFPLVVLMTLWVVLLLSVSQIRRSLVPLEKLREGTRRIAGRDFSTRVKVESGDEFEELAASFNTMARRLGTQFSAMGTMNEIDRSILSALDTEKIVETVLTRMRRLFSCKSAGLALVEVEVARAGLMYIKNEDPESERQLAHINFSPAEVQELYDHPEYLLIEGREPTPTYLEPLAGSGVKVFLVLPIRLEGKLAGLIGLGYVDPPPQWEEEETQSRQLADQVAVALANARLLEQLEDLNWGTLYALARAIDAKSPWTAGHSERVTELALKIGRVMGFNQRQLDNLHRGGLLHDIGKLGTPPEILDKPARLSDEEYHRMQEHARVGARILEPIAAYAEAIPIVLHHHEYYDGSGYPDGQAGEEIDLGARVFTVADHFDALISDRPYRRGLDRRVVLEMIEKDRGSKFDPKVVDALLEVMAGEERRPEEAEARASGPAGPDKGSRLR